MKITCKTTLMGVLVLAILVACMASSAKAQYVRTNTKADDGDSPVYVRTETKWVQGAAGGGGNQDAGYAFCSADSYTWVSGESADLLVQGWGKVTSTWEWTGTPGQAPGGTLSWDHDGGGNATAVGGTDPGGTSFGSAYTRTWVDGDVVIWTWSSGAAYGYVTNNNMAIGEASPDGSPAPYEAIIDESPDNGSYRYSIEWDSYYQDDVPVYAGTSSFYVTAQADCECRAATQGTQGAEANADTTASASVQSVSTFTSN